MESGIADTVIRRARTNLQSDQRRGGGIRGRIQKFSRASAQRLLLTARNLPGLTIMLTLTYPAEFPTDGRRVKVNWTAIRKVLCRRGATVGLWFLEFQKRGAPHFHIFLTNRVDMAVVAEAWYRIVGSGDPLHRLAGTRIESLRKRQTAACYASKYAVKAGQKEVPAEYSGVGRFWGVWGATELWKVHSLPRKTGTTLLRYLRRLYKAKRRTWFYQRKRFKDKGRAGFVAWSVGADSFQRLLTAAQAGTLESETSNPGPRWQSGGKGQRVPKRRGNS